MKKLKGIEILGVSPFGWVKTFNVPQIPLLARGGVLDRGARVIEAGEDGAEAIVPLENNTKWIKRVANELQSSMFSPENMNINGQRAEEAEYSSMVKAFKTALSEMKIELDDEVAGKFVEQTVARAVYSY